jgi:HEAT repeat protein
MKRTIIACLVVLLTTGFSLLAAAPSATAPAAEDPSLRAAAEKTLDETVPGLSDPSPDKRFAAMDKLSRASLEAGAPGHDAARAAWSGAIAKRLGGDLPQASRAWLIRQLQWVGGAEAVPTLVALLSEKDEVVRDCARRALEANPSAEAGEALRAALGKSEAAPWRAAIVNALGARQDATAVAAIAALLKDKDEAVVLASADALGRIGTAEAAAALDKVDAGKNAHLLTAVQNSLVRCADALLAAGQDDAAGKIYLKLNAAENPLPVRVAALRGFLTVLGRGEGAFTDDKSGAILRELLASKDPKIQPLVLPMLIETQGPRAAKTLAAVLPNVQPPAQVALLEALLDRPDKSVRPAVLEVMKSSDAAVQAAAIRVLGVDGNAQDVPALLEVATNKTGDLRDAARWALDHLPDACTEVMLKWSVNKASDAKALAEVVRALAARRDAEAQPLFLRSAENADATVRAEAFKGLEAVGNEKAVAVLVNLLVKATADTDRQAAEKALGAACGRSVAKDAAVAPVAAAMATAPAPAKAALLRSLGRVGGEKAEKTVATALNDSSADVREAAVRVLADWPDAGALPTLLAIAGGDKKVAAQPLPETAPSLALRGVARLVALPDGAPADRLKTLQQAFDLAKRTDDQRLILGTAGGVTSLDALKFVAGKLDNKDLADDAAAAAVRIAKALKGAPAAEVRSIVERAAAATQNQNTRKDAQAQLGSMPK